MAKYRIIQNRYRPTLFDIQGDFTQWWWPFSHWVPLESFLRKEEAEEKIKVYLTNPVVCVYG